MDVSLSLYYIITRAFALLPSSHVQVPPPLVVVQVLLFTLNDHQWLLEVQREGCVSE